MDSLPPLTAPELVAVLLARTIEQTSNKTDLAHHALRLRRLFETLLYYHDYHTNNISVTQNSSESIALSSNHTNPFILNCLLIALRETINFRNYNMYALDFNFINTNLHDYYDRYAKKFINVLSQVRSAIITKNEDLAGEAINSLELNIIDLLPDTNDFQLETFKSYLTSTLSLAASYGLKKVISPLMERGANPIPALRVIYQLLNHADETAKALFLSMIETLKKSLNNIKKDTIEQHLWQALEEDALELFITLFPYIDNNFLYSDDISQDNIFHRAAATSSTKIVNYLMQQNEKIRALLHTPNILGKTPIQIESLKLQFTALVIIRTMLEQGANPYELDVSDQTLPCILIELLRFGRSIPLDNYRERSIFVNLFKQDPILLAIIRNDAAALPELLPVATPQQWQDGLLLAVGQGHSEIVRMLLDRGLIFDAIANVRGILQQPACIMAPEQRVIYSAIQRLLEDSITNLRTMPNLYFNSLSSSLMLRILFFALASRRS